jgi:hypothetical protein
MNIKRGNAEYVLVMTYLRTMKLCTLDPRAMPWLQKGSPMRNHSRLTRMLSPDADRPQCVEGWM